MRKDEALGLGPWDRLLIRLASLALRLLSRTLRYRLENWERLDRLVAAGRPVLLCTWHGRMLPGVFPLRRYHPVVMISQSRDGERIALLVERLGWRPVRGSSSRGGARALVEMVRELSQGAVGTHIVDGPGGPRGQLKPGLVYLAQRAGATVLPGVIAARWRWEAGSWDRTQLPLPGSRVWIRLLDPIEIPAGADAAALETLRQPIELTLERELARIDREIRS